MSSSVLLTRVPLRTCKDREGHPVSSVVKCHLADYQVSFVPWKSAQACSGLISGPGDMVHAYRRLYALSIQTHGRYHVINMDWRPERSSEIQEHAKLRRSKMTPGKAGVLLLFWLTNVNKPSGRKCLIILGRATRSRVSMWRSRFLLPDTSKPGLAEGPRARF